MASKEKECPNCQRLQTTLDQVQTQLQQTHKQLKDAQKKIADLEAEVRRGRRQAAPFSKDQAKSNPKRPGRRPGRGRFTHRKPPPEKEIQQTHWVPLDHCPDCGGPLERRKPHEQFQVDLPQVPPHITRFRTESGYCPHCQTRVRSRHPDQLSLATGAAGVSVGPRAKALAADLKHRLGLSYGKIVELFKVAFGLEVTAGGLCQAETRLAEKAAPIYRELVDAIRQAAAVHADETGWRIGVLGAWLWVFTSEKITVYTIDERRSHEVVIEILGREFAGVLVCDCFTAYDAQALADWLQQKCFAHFLRALRKLEREKTRGAVRFPRALVEVLREALELGAARQQGEIDETVFTARREELEARLDALICEHRQFSDPDNRRMAKRMRKQRAHLFTFLDVEAVEATNNRAERALRPAVVVRKRFGCNRTERGAQVHAVLASILESVKQQGKDPLTSLTQILKAVGPEELPSLAVERSPPALADEAA